MPSLVLIMALAAALGPSLINAAIAAALVRIPVYVRISRGQTLLIREMSFVTDAETFKASKLHILRWHILANILSPVMVQATLDLGSTILLAFALSFIGLGAQQPTAEWGAMVQRQVLQLLPAKARQTGASVLFISRDLAVISQFCDRIYVMYAGRVVESGPAQKVLGNPQHPYTAALIKALPEDADPGEPLASFPGTVPNLVKPPKGCAF